MDFNAKEMVIKALKALEVPEQYLWLLELDSEESYHFKQAVFHLSQIIASMQKKESLLEDQEAA